MFPSDINQMADDPFNRFIGHFCTYFSRSLFWHISEEYKTLYNRARDGREKKEKPMEAD